MLELKDIKKQYIVGDTKIDALKGVSISFRKNEFVSILGPSGCGKTTLLNIIGGLDQYTSGDLVINNKSTKTFKDRDWDTYRNHSIGFVFQSYNLIPHQSVLSNVELALTLSGVSKSERKKRALEALEKVGLADQVNKKPNQISGGQMQRVAIARALVNNPDILLADEPTGALDSETSIQIMEILKEISKEKLIIMVTHNPEIANKYSNRIIRLLDGTVISDSDPYNGSTLQIGERKDVKDKKKLKTKKTSMNFFTALSLSLNNLMTKKARTFMTSFAGSIGIIGIALIMSVSTGVQSYIDAVQRDTLSSYPITLQAESVDMTTLISTISGASKKSDNAEHELDALYASPIMAELINSLNTMETNKNNLKAFKTYIESKKSEDYISSVQYTYNLNLNIYSKDVNGKIFKSDVMEFMHKMMGGSDLYQGSNLIPSYGSYNVWKEILPGKNDALISDTVNEQYDVIYGKTPEAFNEIVLIVDEKNEISDMVLFALGLTSEQELIDSMLAVTEGKTIDVTDQKSWSYEEICNMAFKVILSSDTYQKQSNGTYINLAENETGLQYLYDNAATDLKIVGILRPSKDAISTSMNGSIGYTSKLTEYVINETGKRDIIKEQLSNPTKDVLTNLPFKGDQETKLTDEQKAEDIKAYFNSLSNSEKAAIYTEIMSTPSEDYIESAITQALSNMTADDIKESLTTTFSQQMNISEEQAASYVEKMDNEARTMYISQILTAQIQLQYASEVQGQLGTMTTDAIAAMFDQEEFNQAQYASFYDKFMPAMESDITYEESLALLGYVDINSPSTINIYATSFDNKEKIASLIKNYNKGVDEVDKISYTDYIKMLMSSITTIIDAISYVLIAFVAISLIVSSIMIGIITYISVLERTKEIGVLRAIGASKKDISRVFNAETLIVGFVAGVIGIGCTLLLNILVNIILHALTGIVALNAVLPVAGGISLVIISMLLTFIAGLLPSSYASKKDPVIALRSE
jgi:putative ABC transport system permease protein